MAVEASVARAASRYSVSLAPDAITQDDTDALAAWLTTRPRLTQDVLVNRFEHTFADWLGRKHAIYVNSGSSANLLAVAALLESGRLALGDKVAVPALSWSTDIAPIIQLGLQPVLVDSVGTTLAMDPAGTTGTQASILVSVLGLVPDMDQYTTPMLIEDCCESLGSRWRGRLLGTFGLLSTFSFFYGHHITTVEGGMVTTDDDALAVILRQLRAHGWDRDTGGLPDSFNFIRPGFNVRNTEIGAFLGLRQMDKVERIITQRHERFMEYQGILGWPEVQPHAYVSAMAYPYVSDARGPVRGALAQAGVETRMLIAGNIARHPFWLERFGPELLPIADLLHDEGYYVPCHQDMTSGDVSMVAQAMI